MNNQAKAGICSLSQIPLRATPAEKSELTSQLLFGEDYAVLDATNKWLLIRSNFDSYEGWIDRKQHTELPPDKAVTPIASREAVCISIIGEIINTSGTVILIPFGSNLPAFDGMTCHFANQKFHFKGEHTADAPSGTELLLPYANKFLGAAYLWGGRTIFGIDCSGFVQVVFKACGIKLMRDASQQAGQGQTINFIEESRAGDIAFFDNDEGHIIHTGILSGDGHIIHASGQVRIDPIDHHGIFHSQSQQYTHKLRLIRRVTE